MGGLTFDTGALTALERRSQRIRSIWTAVIEKERIVTVPSAVIAEWWRGRTDIRDSILAHVRIEPLDEALAKSAGETLATMPRATMVDAIVMASAARRGDIVYTSDFEDLEALRAIFPAVRVLRV